MGNLLMGLDTEEAEESRSTVRPTARKASAGMSMRGFEPAAFLKPGSFKRLASAGLAPRRRVIPNQVETTDMRQRRKATLLRFDINSIAKPRRHPKPRHTLRMPG